MTCRLRANRARRRPICTAARPPTPASTSSNTIVVPVVDAASTTSRASITRDNSPPDALLASGNTVIPAMRGETELDQVDAVAAGMGLGAGGKRQRRGIVGSGRHGRHRDGELRVRHRQTGQLTGDFLGQPLGGLCA